MTIMCVFQQEAAIETLQDLRHPTSSKCLTEHEHLIRTAYLPTPPGRLCLPSVFDRVFFC